MDLYAIAIEFLVTANSVQEARKKIENLLEVKLPMVTAPGIPLQWETRRLRGVTAPFVKEIELRASPPFRGKFGDEPTTEAKIKQLERLTNELREQGVIKDVTKEDKNR